MAHDMYEHPHTLSKEDRGHDGKCEYVNNSGPSCQCDWVEGGQYVRDAAMTFMGWKRDTRSQHGTGWYRGYGRHFISVCLLIDGWQYRWEKGPGITYLEHRGFAHVHNAMEHLFGVMCERFDRSNKAFWEHGQMRQQLIDVGIEPKELGKKQKPSVPGPMKHEVTAIMDDPEDRGAGRGCG